MKIGCLELECLEKLKVYDEEVDDILRDLTTFLEPLLLLIMGLAIGAIALSVLLPIYQLISSFS